MRCASAGAGGRHDAGQGAKARCCRAIGRRAQLDELSKNYCPLYKIHSLKRNRHREIIPVLRRSILCTSYGGCAGLGGEPVLWDIPRPDDGRRPVSLRDAAGSGAGAMSSPRIARAVTALRQATATCPSGRCTAHGFHRSATARTTYRSTGYQTVTNGRLEKLMPPWAISSRGRALVGHALPYSCEHVEQIAQGEVTGRQSALNVMGSRAKARSRVRRCLTCSRSAPAARWRSWLMVSPIKCRPSPLI